MKNDFEIGKDEVNDIIGTIEDIYHPLTTTGLAILGLIPVIILIVLYSKFEDRKNMESNKKRRKN